MSDRTRLEKIAYKNLVPKSQKSRGPAGNTSPFKPQGTPPRVPRKPKDRRVAKTTKLFVLDTNVLLHDPTCWSRFEEHDVYVPIVTLEELDDHKKGTSEVARNGRQVSREFDIILATMEGGMEDGIPLYGPSKKLASGRLYFQSEAIIMDLPNGLPVGKADNQILAVVMHLQRIYPEREVILVSKDINMRIKARILHLQAKDYLNDKVLEDSDMMYTGAMLLPSDFWEKHEKGMKSGRSKERGTTFYKVEGPLCASFTVNQLISLEGNEPFDAMVTAVSGNTAVFETLIDYTHPKSAVWGITARNREQSFALNLLMDPNIDFVSLLGQAGTGKTLLTLAAALTQVLETKLYSEIIMTRVTVPVGEDIGFLPGTEEEKMGPWMGALEDNLEVLNKTDVDTGEWGRAATHDLIRNRIKIKSLNFMRGRTFLNKFLIIDEAQNLTPKQMKTLITRAGPGTKVVCMGNIAQIDTPYLTEGSSGLTYVVERFKGWPHQGHTTLIRGERSRLADYASEVL